MTTREYWIRSMTQIVDPVFSTLEQGKLKKTMPLEFHAARKEFAPLEAFGRSILGIAPWLEMDLQLVSEQEANLIVKYRRQILHCISMAVDPDSPDFMVFDHGGQPLVDAAFLSHALIRAPKSIAEKLPEKDRENLIRALKSSRKIVACSTNWLFFTAMVEAGLYVLGSDFDLTRVLYALRTFQGWYKGDGIYGDGEFFHWDYYNSFVIQPMYVDLVELFDQVHPEIHEMKAVVLSHAVRYASILEKMIAPDGSYPIIGRSVCYRFGAFQMLAQAALEKKLDSGLSPASVRCALTAVILKVMSSPNLFDENGWLRPGVYGYQPELAEEYINIGSLYLCSAVFLPLGLSPEDPFWKDPDEDWSSKKVWNEKFVPIDHADD